MGKNKTKNKTKKIALYLIFELICSDIFYLVISKNHFTFMLLKFVRIKFSYKTIIYQEALWPSLTGQQRVVSFRKYLFVPRTTLRPGQLDSTQWTCPRVLSQRKEAIFKKTENDIMKRKKFLVNKLMKEGKPAKKRLDARLIDFPPSSVLEKGSEYCQTILVRLELQTRHIVSILWME